MSEPQEKMMAVITTRKAIEAKEREIEKRKKVIETISSTNRSKRKDDAKVEAIDSKITNTILSYEKTINYYRDEITKSEKKFNEDLRNLRAKIELEESILQKKFEIQKGLLKNKYEFECQKLELRFYSYRDYCHEAMKFQDEKKDLETQPLEKKKESLQKTLEKTEDDDRVLVRLKIEKRQLQELENECLKNLQSPNSER
jgi:hypothetical protein